MSIFFHPGLLLVLTGLLIYLIPGRSSKILYLLIPVAGFVWALMQKGDNVEKILNISGVTELQILRMDSMAWAFTFTFLLAAVLLAVYNLHTNDQKELAAETIYAGSARWCCSCRRLDHIVDFLGNDGDRIVARGHCIRKTAGLESRISASFDAYVWWEYASCGHCHESIGRAASGRRSRIWTEILQPGLFSSV